MTISDIKEYMRKLYTHRQNMVSLTNIMFVNDSVESITLDDGEIINTQSLLNNNIFFLNEFSKLLLDIIDNAEPKINLGNFETQQIMRDKK